MNTFSIPSSHSLFWGFLLDIQFTLEQVGVEPYQLLKVCAWGCSQPSTSCFCTQGFKQWQIVQHCSVYLLKKTKTPRVSGPLSSNLRCSRVSCVLKFFHLYSVSSNLSFKFPVFLYVSVCVLGSVLGFGFQSISSLSTILFLLFHTIPSSHPIACFSSDDFLITFLDARFYVSFFCWLSFTLTHLPVHFVIWLQEGFYFPLGLLAAGVVCFFSTPESWHSLGATLC